MIRTVLLTDDGKRIRGYLRTEGEPTRDDKLNLLGVEDGDPDALGRWQTVPDHPAYGDDVDLKTAEAAANK